jgi:hypothetical protein
MNIKLNEAEQKLAIYLAKSRYKNARGKNISNQKIGPQSNEMTDLNGIGAEIAFCKINNCYPDTSITEKLPFADALTGNGYFVDVKTTTYQSGHLVAAKWKTGEGVDYYCLVIGNFPEYRIAGYMKKDELLQDSRLKDLGHGKGFAAEQNELDEKIMVSLDIG